MSEVLGLIPARGGSKTVPDKNIAIVGGLPLIAWTLLAAREARGLTRIAVTTDSERIADTAAQYGAEIPFLRPEELARDDTPGIAPILHALRWYEAHEGYRPEYVVCLQPTSPLRSAGDIDAGIDLALEKDADAVVSVTPVTYHPYWMKQVDGEGRIVEFIHPGQPVARRQDLPPVYALNGALYLARRRVLLERESWYTHRTYAYMMPAERSLDVDAAWDLYLADLVLRSRHGDC